MSSLLGLETYESEHSEGEETRFRQQHQESQQHQQPPINTSADAPSQGETVADGSGELLEENTDSRLGESLGDEGESRDDPEAPDVDSKSSPRDDSQDQPKEAKPFFMPLPSPLVRLDHASQANSSPLEGQDPPSASVEERENKEQEHAEENGKEVDNDIIKPEFRGLLPPEPTGQANPRLQAKIATFLDTIQGDFTNKIKSKKDFGNPAVLSQICQYCHVDDKGTNFPEDRMVHPSVYDIKDFHESLMNEFRKTKRPEETKSSAAATTTPHVGTTTIIAAAGQSTIDASAAAAGTANGSSRAAAAGTSNGSSRVVAAGTSNGSSRKRVNKWGSAPPSSNALPFMGQHMQMTASPATPAPAAAAATTGGRVGFSVDPAATARVGQAAIVLNAQTQAVTSGNEVQQQVEQLARVQVSQDEAADS